MLVRAIGFALALIMAAMAPALPVGAQTADRSAIALTIEIEGPIGPAMARHVKESLAKAADRRAEVVILRLNTPGGLVTSMREIVADVLGSPVPVLGYVAPSGAHAASAGTYILYATHLAAMAPGTNLGAATPVDVGRPLPKLPGGGRDEETDKDKKGQAANPATDTMTAKATNDAVALIRSLAELRGRNADWAEKAVREAASLSARAALEEHVIDIVARSPADLLDQADGRAVEIGGVTRHLATKGLAVETLERGWLTRLLSIITDPNIAFILLLIGVYGLIFEFATPGAVAPGVVGAICLLLGLYALNLLPISYAGLALVLVGLVLLVIEAYNPTVVVGFGGLIAFLLGAAMLFKGEGPDYRLSWTTILLTGAITGALIVTLGRFVWAARSRPVRAGAQTLHGAMAEILDWRGGAGHVLAEGERWQARGEEAFAPGETVEVTGVEGLTLAVRRRQGHAARGGGLP